MNRLPGSGITSRQVPVAPAGAQIQVTSSDWIGSVSWNSSTRMRGERR
jgi:hypothetical protein